jgi:hypothetical protein
LYVVNDWFHRASRPDPSRETDNLIPNSVC